MSSKKQNAVVSSHQLIYMNSTPSLKKKVRENESFDLLYVPYSNLPLTSKFYIARLAPPQPKQKCREIKDMNSWLLDVQDSKSW